MPSTIVKLKHRATGVAHDEIIADRPDSLPHETFFVVSPTFEVAACRTL